MKKQLYAFVTLAFVLAGCGDFFNPDPANDALKKLNDAAAYHNAPWVPVEIVTGGLVNNPSTVNSSGEQAGIGFQPQLVKKGYSFRLTAEDSSYPLKGWQAWLRSTGEVFASWQSGATPPPHSAKIRLNSKPTIQKART
jgi:hypothetical protein